MYKRQAQACLFPFKELHCCLLLAEWYPILSLAKYNRKPKAILR